MKWKQKNGKEGWSYSLHEGGLQSQWLLLRTFPLKNGMPAQNKNVTINLRLNGGKTFQHPLPNQAPKNIGGSSPLCPEEDPPKTPPQPHTHKPPNPGHKYTPRGKKMLRGVYFFGPIGMKGGEEGSARVGSGGTCGEGGAVGGAVVMQNVLFVS